MAKKEEFNDPFEATNVATMPVQKKTTDERQRIDDMQKRLGPRPDQKRPRPINTAPHVIDFSKEDGSNTPQGRYRIEWNGLTREVMATDANDAWARFCDLEKTWPSPKSFRTVEFLG